MKREDKELLFKDLSARVPYGTKIQAGEFKETLTDAVKWGEGARVNGHKLETIKPYLRSLSSMTEEEDKEFAMLQTDFYIDGWLYPIAAVNMVNWLNAHHFDYRGMIEKGLALEVPKDMYEV